MYEGQLYVEFTRRLLLLFAPTISKVSVISLLLILPTPLFPHVYLDFQQVLIIQQNNSVDATWGGTPYCTTSMRSPQDLIFRSFIPRTGDLQIQAQL